MTQELFQTTVIRIGTKDGPEEVCRERSCFEVFGTSGRAVRRRHDGLVSGKHEVSV